MSRARSMASVQGAAGLLLALLACGPHGQGLSTVPAVAITSPSADLTATNGVVQVAIAVTGGASTVKLLADGEPVATLRAPFEYAWDTRALPEATYELRAEVEDGGQTYQSTPRSVLVDRTPPTPPTIDARVCAAGVTSSVLTGTAEANATVTLYEGSTALASAVTSGGGSWSATLALGAGTHTVIATATDAAGNVSPASSPVSMVVDGSAGQIPAPPTLTRPPPAVTNYPSLFVEGLATEGNTVDLYWDGTVARTFLVTQADGTWGVFVDVPQGTHAFTATQTSPAGCTSAPTSPVTVVDDRTAPAAPVITGQVPSVVNVAGPAAITLSGTADASTTVTVFAGVVVLGSVQAAASGGAWSLTVATSSLPDGSYALTAIAQDAAGNTSPEASTAAMLVDRTPPGAPVFASVPSVVNVASSTVSVSGTAEAASRVNVYRGGALLGSATAAASGGGWSVSVAATALPDGSYPLTATATDEAGNVSAEATSNTILVDRTPPAAPTLAVSATGVKVNVAFTVSGAAAAEPSLTVRVYEVVGSNMTPLGGAVSAASGTWTEQLSLATAGAHALVATAVDEAGNESAASNTVSVTVGP